MRWKRILTLLLVLTACGAAFMGSLWQIEISIINDLNGWEFKYFANLVTINNWQARDIFYVVQSVAFLGAVLSSYLISREIHFN